MYAFYILLPTFCIKKLKSRRFYSSLSRKKVNLQYNSKIPKL